MDYRLIVLLNNNFKIISRILANRLALILPKMVEKLQSDFIRRRNILGRVTLTQEVIHQYKKKNERKGLPS